MIVFCNFVNWISLLISVPSQRSDEVVFNQEVKWMLIASIDNFSVLEISLLVISKFVNAYCLLLQYVVFSLSDGFLK